MQCSLQAAWGWPLQVPQSAARWIIPYSHSYSFIKPSTWVSCLQHAYRASRDFSNSKHITIILGKYTNQTTKRSVLLFIPLFLSFSLTPFLFPSHAISLSFSFFLSYACSLMLTLSLSLFSPTFSCIHFFSPFLFLSFPPHALSFMHFFLHLLFPSFLLTYTLSYSCMVSHALWLPCTFSLFFSILLSYIGCLLSITSTKKRDHINTALALLPWHPVHYRIHCKIPICKKENTLELWYKTIINNGAYITDRCEVTFLSDTTNICQ